MRRMLLWLAVTCGATACVRTSSSPERAAVAEPGRVAVVARVQPALPADVGGDDAREPVGDDTVSDEREADDDIVEIDHDNEDLLDDEDRCPDLPEDRDEFADVDGCPEPAPIAPQQD